MKTIQDIDINKLIPQRPPFVMIDRLLDYETTNSSSELEVRSDNIFCQNGTLSAAGLMENMAQTCAARIGYHCLVNNLSIQIGVIGAVSNFEVFRTPKVGERIVTTIEVLQELFQITLVKAVVRCGAEVIAEAKMKIALMNDDSTN